MDGMSEICANCGHEFKLHQLATFGLWYCDFNDNCICNEFIPKQILSDDDDSYLWN